MQEPTLENLFEKDPRTFAILRALTIAAAKGDAETRTRAIDYIAAVMDDSYCVTIEPLRDQQALYLSKNPEQKGLYVTTIPASTFATYLTNELHTFILN